MKINKELIADVYPMSDIQQGMVFTTLQHPGKGIYHDQFVYFVPRIKDEVLFEKAVRLMTDVHPVLRTGFDFENFSKQVQVVYKQITPSLYFTDISIQDEATQEATITDFMQQSRAIPYDFSKAPLWKLSVFHLSAEESLYLIEFHHAILDGWSLALFNSQLFQVYLELEKDGNYQPAPLAVNMKDAIVEELLEKNNPATAAFWKDKLADYNKLNIFQHTTIFEESRQALGVQLSAKIKAAAAKQQIAYKHVIYGALMYVLKIFSSEQNFVCGIVSNTRPVAKDGDRLLGCFLNTLPMRLSFGDYKHLTWAGYFNLIEEEMRVLKTKSRSTLYEISKICNQQMGAENPFFDILFNHVDFHNAYKTVSVSGALKKLKLRSYEATNTYLDFNLVDIADGSLELHYKAMRELVPGLSLARIHVFFLQVLDHYLHAPDALMAATSFVTAAERDQIMNGFNGTDVLYDPDTTVLDLFREKAALFPDNIAVSDESQQMSFQELDILSDQLAHYLQTYYQVGLNDLVGIRLERSRHMLLAILGILKAGGAYVPVDTAYPEEKIGYIQSDSNYKTCIDTQFLQTFREAAGPLKEPLKVPADTFAYAIYTSGSTGHPKGVINDHAGLYNRLIWMRDDLAIGPDDVIMQKTPYTFDVSVWELMMPLITGCRLVFAKPEGHKDPHYIQDLIFQEQVTIIHFVPSMLGIFLEELESHKCKSLRHVVCSGEALPASMLATFKAALPWVRIHNLYGPTEAAIDVTAIDLTDKELVTIGKPVANTKIYIVDEHLQLLPIGVPGELLIEGVQVARGYLNQPSLTASRFIDSPFTPGARAYRTGDLARYLPDGTIYYMGRMDDQVKIRGNRIELGEIESRILSWGHAEQCGVVVKDKTLVAYVVPGDDYNKESLFSYLNKHLPEYMVPGIVMELDALPLTSSGKLNRRALPEPVSVDEYIAPGNEIEAALADIWKAVLGKEKVSIHDNFFRIGGDSILSIRLVSRINKHFNTALSIAGLYQYNTISKLATILFMQDDAPATDQLLGEIAALQAVAKSELPEGNQIEEVYPMRDIQKGMVALSSINPESGMYHDQFIYHIPTVDLPVLQLAFERLVEKHSTLRSSFDLTSLNQEVQIVWRAVPVKIVEVQNSSEEAIRQVMAAERRQPFNTRFAPLWRIHLFRLSATHDLLLFQFHHAILDGWSVASLYTELFQVYNQLLTDRNYTPPKLKISGLQAAVAEWADKKRNGHLSFWQEELKGYQRLGLFGKNFNYQTFSQRYAPHFKNTLQSRCQEEGINLKALLYGALAYVLQLLSGERDFVLGMVNNNRPVTEDGDRLLGCFLNTTPVRNQFDELANGTLGSYFKAVDKKLLSLKPYERTTLYDIAKALNEPPGENSPFFDVLYNYIDFHVLNELTTQKESSPLTDVRTFESTNTALGLTVNASGGELVLTYTLNRELKIDFSAARIHQYIDLVLHAFIANSAQPVKTLCLLPEEEKFTLLHTFNDTQQEFPLDSTVLDLFAAQVASVPQATALIYEGNAVTYQQLDEQSSQLAHFLIAKGVQPGELIPLCMERSADMIIAIFAVLKAGAAYLPIDINNPPDRIHFMLEDSGARFVISRTPFNEWFKEIRIAPLYLDLISYDTYATEAPSLHKDPHALVYVIYTSGSTGKPKGVMITHYSLVARLCFYKGYYGLNEADNILFYRSFSFDGAIEEYLLPFTVGATCVIAGTSFKQDVFNNMITFIEQYRISKVNMPPVLLQDIIDILPDEQVGRISSLRHVVSGGDKLNVEVVNSFYKKVGADTHINLYNSYGPTENTIDSTILKCGRDSTQISIGRPVANTQAYILDANGLLLPLGVAGEIAVSGAGLSTGYLNRPGLTAEKFVPHPFQEGALMYKTGDIGRWLPDGNIAFIGRVDNQVKIRGHRIELGEIEAVALQSGYLENIVVLVKEDAAMRKYLVAYVIPAEGYEQANVYTYLKAHLPEYMVPGMIIEMEQFPVTNNGKLDRNGLPEPAERTIPAANYVAPGNDTEVRIAAVWQQLLHLQQIGVQDNFFQQGGDSLTIVKLHTALQKVFDVQINIVDLFNHTTIATQALLFQQEEESGEENKTVETIRF